MVRVSFWPMTTLLPAAPVSEPMVWLTSLRLSTEVFATRVTGVLAGSTGFKLLLLLYNV